MPDTWPNNPRRRNGPFLCEDSEKTVLKRHFGPKTAILAKKTADSFARIVR